MGKIKIYKHENIYGKSVDNIVLASTAILLFEFYIE